MTGNIGIGHMARLRIRDAPNIFNCNNLRNGSSRHDIPGKCQAFARVARILRIFLEAFTALTIVVFPHRWQTVRGGQVSPSDDLDLRKGRKEDL